MHKKLKKASSLLAKKKVGIVLISENQEGTEMLKSARRLLGNTRGMTSMVMKPGHPLNQMKADLRRAMARVNARSGILLLTDIYGSTQCNVCMTCLKKGSVELMTGFNLPMLVKLAMLQSSVPLKEMVNFIEEYGRLQIRHVNQRKGMPAWNKKKEKR